MKPAIGCPSCQEHMIGKEEHLANDFLLPAILNAAPTRLTLLIKDLDKGTCRKKRDGITTWCNKSNLSAVFFMILRRWLRFNDLVVLCLSGHVHRILGITRHLVATPWPLEQYTGGSICLPLLSAPSPRYWCDRYVWYRSSWSIFVEIFQ